MAIKYTIFKTAGGSLSILPGGINNADADISLIGQGATIWGESTNESLFRMVENFNCPEKIGTPGTPQDSGDLGLGLGINNPIEGQLWFNTTTDKLMVNSGGSAWKSAGGIFSGTTAPTAPFEGDLWYDTNVPQLKVYNGAAFDSTSLLYLLLDGTAPMTGDLDLSGNNIVNVADAPTGGQYAANKNYVDGEITILSNALLGGLLDSQYVEVIGDTMSGTLTMNANLINFTGVITAGPDIRSTAAALFSAADDFHINVDNDNSGGGEFRVNKGADLVDGVNETKLFTVENTGRIKANTPSYETLVDADEVIPNKKYVDDTAATATSVGTVEMFAASSIPTGYLLCNGQAVSRVTFAALFALLNADGLLFGNGDGSTTFNVPNYSGRSPMGVGASTGVIGGVDTITLAEEKGSWQSLVTITNMPLHDHGGGDHIHGDINTNNAGTSSRGYNRGQNIGVRNTNTSGNIITPEGGGATFDTHSPVLGMNFIIKT